MSQDTGAAKLPGLPILKTADQALARWAQAVAEHLEVRAGARGNPMERSVTVRELLASTRVLDQLQANKSTTANANELVLSLGGGLSAAVSVDAFAKSILNSKLYKDLAMKLNDPARFDDLPQAVRQALLKPLAEEAARRGADISVLETKLQSATDSLAMKVEEVTASVEGAASGVRELTFASANQDRAQAGKIIQMEASLGNFYQDGTAGRASLESTMTVTADRVTGLAGEYMVKVNAGKAVVGFGLAASEDPTGATTSSFLVQADTFAVTGTGISPVVPFGVDTVNNTIYMNGQVRINATGPTIEQISKSITLTASSTVFKVATSGSPNPASITLTAALNNGLTGTPAFTVIDGTATLTGSGLTRTLAYSSMSSERVTVRASLTVGGYLYQNDITLYKAFDGTAGTNGTNGANGSNGTNGTNGAAGTRGSVTRYGSGSWNDSVANSLVPGGVPILGDTVTLSTSTSATTKYWDGGQPGSWVDPGVVLNGNLLVNGTVSANAINAGTLSGVSIAIGSGNTTILNTVNSGVPGGFYGMRSWSLGTRSLTVDQYASGDVPGDVMIYAKGYGGYSGIRGWHNSTSGGIVGALNGKAFHAEVGTAGPFTGSHDAAVPTGTVMTPGDIVVDDGCLIRGDLSNTFFRVKTATQAQQRGVIGVYTHGMGPMAEYTLLSAAREEVPGPKTALYDSLKHEYDMVEINALGEGQINVCGEGGDLEAGDLIVTSSIPGKGMRQSDDLIRNTTVAKCREAVTFSSPTEVRQVACIYLCG